MSQDFLYSGKFTCDGVSQFVNNITVIDISSENTHIYWFAIIRNELFVISVIKTKIGKYCNVNDRKKRNLLLNWKKIIIELAKKFS